MFGEEVLGLWTAASWTWWLVSLKLVLEAKKAPPAIARVEKSDPRFLSIFKPLPLLTAEGLGAMAEGLASFVAQLDERSELLLGVHAADRSKVALFLEEMAIHYPNAGVRVVYRSEPDAHPNPKVAWQSVLALEAQDDLWLWSDADVIAPKGLIGGLRAEFSASATGLLTFPYVIRETRSTPAFFDAFFVNADFYPGVLLLRKLNRTDFGMGAGMLFSRDDFQARVKWNDLGAELADDFYLGQKLTPVCISRTTLAIRADADNWGSALSHYFRWGKIIRWNRPGATAARIIVMPLAGWFALALVHGMTLWPWVGWATVWQVDVMAALVLCRSVGCRTGFKGILAAELWAFWRILSWLACWVPFAVQWGTSRWTGPRKMRAEH